MLIVEFIIPNVKMYHKKTIYKPGNIQNVTRGNEERSFVRVRNMNAASFHSGSYLASHWFPSLLDFFSSNVLVLNANLTQSLLCSGAIFC